MARRSDVDMNGHINNVTFLAWAIETMPNDIYESHRVSEVGAPVCLVVEKQREEQPALSESAKHTHGAMSDLNTELCMSG